MKLILIFLCSILTARAATLTTNGSSSDVQAKLNSAVAGDIVAIPAGTFTWSTGVSRSSIPANVTIQGAGTTATGGGNQTTITDNVTGGSPLIALGVSATGVFRMTGITFQSGTGSIKDGGTIQIGGSGSASNVRLDHCNFDFDSSNNYKIVQFGSGIHGVMDHCILRAFSLNALFFYNGRFGSGDIAGNYEWTLPTNPGGSDYFYIEDNIVNGTQSRVWDGYTAAKVVVRFNTVANAGLSESHATGHSGDDRGTRAQEVYGNLSTYSGVNDPPFCGADVSSGTALVWGNSWDEVYKSLYLFNVTRKNNDTYGQVATPGGWGYAGTQFNGTGSNWDGGTFNGTDTLRGYPCIDQPGRGPGDLITGLFPSKLNDTTGTIRWPNQALEPIYLWNNTGTFAPGWGEGDRTVNNNTLGRVVENRDYYLPASGVQTSPTSPFNGTVGVGWGTLANRPTTCTAGVAYFATDQGSWNQSTSNPYGVQQNGADGVLYKATATNTWTLYYTPYTYPHPLQSATSTASGVMTTPTVNVGNLKIQ